MTESEQKAAKPQAENSMGKEQKHNKKDEKIHSEKIRYDNADKIYE
ncbi:hypothetical protein [Thalassobacillus pellis]|nr:hypothetical protein [Thalassobacillus pellis]MBM7553459.1 hypothetical protein [Thalassobacillus pellis]